MAGTACWGDAGSIVGLLHLPEKKDKPVVATPRTQAHRRRRFGALVLTVGGLAALTACGPTVTTPDLVGMRLDDAHNKLKDLDVENFDDKDVIGEEDAIFRDANWIVVRQEPAAGSKDVDAGTTIKLFVGNQDDDEVLKMIPGDSAFAREVAKDKAAKADKAAKEAAEKEAAQEEADAEAAEKAADPYRDQRDEDGFVTSADYGSAWPLTVDAGFLGCPESFGDRNGAVTFTTLDGDEYALNGQASHDYPDLRPIWADDPTYGKNGGVKKSTAILIDDGLDEC